jgi:hypothetical protein
LKKFKFIGWRNSKRSATADDEESGGDGGESGGTGMK